MIHRSLRMILATATAVLLLSQAAFAAVFYGITVHVSTNNIKVHDPKSGQTLAFTVTPKFKDVFSQDGKTTYQMNAIRAGQYVKVYYDQHFLGLRHADKIYILTSRNYKMGSQ
ncbi:MAG: hypothetical protein JO024_05485 [Candidatus Eremiobacteraeota bacterium]|nr:hypothetical protein [Candidatus Eremiobacteraeota bacterium]MBV9736662.1 hypothetical protein [Candidatus Eremiobacteraeota bacterium]